MDLASLRLESAGNGRVTEVPAAADGSWSVQVLADIQDGFSYLPRILSEGEQFGARAVIIAGDLQRGDGGRHLGLVLRELRNHASHVPLFAVPGNHDAMSSSDRAAFEAAFGTSEFEFRIGSTWFEGLDSTNPATFAAQRARVSTRIEQATRSGQRVVAIRHHWPLRDAGGLPDDELAEVLRNPTVAFVIAGHAHTSRVDRIGGTRFVVAPPSGDRSHGQGQTAVSYLLIRATPAGELSLELHQFNRDNLLDAKSTWMHAWLVHVLPLLGRGAEGDLGALGILADRG